MSSSGLAINQADLKCVNEDSVRGRQEPAIMTYLSLLSPFSKRESARLEPTVLHVKKNDRK